MADVNIAAVRRIVPLESSQGEAADEEARTVREFDCRSVDCTTRSGSVKKRFTNPVGGAPKERFCGRYSFTASASPVLALAGVVCCGSN